jgi:hypothetical protein
MSRLAGRAVSETPRGGRASGSQLVWRRRLSALIGFALVAFAIGAIVGATSSGLSAEALGARFVSQWSHGAYHQMYGETDLATRLAFSESRFKRIYQDADTTATVLRVSVTGTPHTTSGGLVVVPVRVRTRLFGTINSSFSLPIADHGEGPRVSWSRSLAFPGVRSGERLSRHMTLPPRASLLAREGSTLASGPATTPGERSSPLGAYGTAVVGSVGPIPEEERTALESQGVPDHGVVGVSGLELAFDSRLRGMPGGELLAGERALARAQPHAGAAVRTTISPAVQQAAVTALGGQYGGIVVLQPATGQILAVAGIGLDSVQPPGSTFKMITVTGALEAGLTSMTSSYPVESHAVLEGVTVGNSEGEYCGGTLPEAFAVSCNSVFAPLGVKLGARRLVATARRFGFDEAPPIPGAAESTIPPASQLHGELAVGASALGQDKDQASALEMATVAATIADSGRRPRPTFGVGGAARTGVSVTSPRVAHLVRQLMVGVVESPSGTGHAAAIPGVEVAGKTGTAELRSAAQCTVPGANCSAQEREEAQSRENTDAWFAAFAPAGHPQVAVAVLLVKDGFGGETAAPVAREVIEAALSAGV